MRAIPCPIPSDQLRRLYEEEKLTDEKIVERIGADASLKRVRSWRKRFGIKTINRTERHEVVPIEGCLRSLLVGSMLGDGRLAIAKHTARFMERHGNDQKDYLEWKAEQWGLWIKSGIRPVTGRIGEKTFQLWLFETVCHKTLLPWFDLFYSGPKGRKRFTREVVDLVDSFALAVWYMDDGSVGWWPRITFGLDEESRQTCFAIFEKFSLKPRWEHIKGPTGNFIFEGEEQAEHFIRLVRPHIPSCMERKLTFGFQGPHYQVRKALPESKLREMAEAGVPIRRIARELGQAPTTVDRYLRDLGISHARTVGRPKNPLP